MPLLTERSSGRGRIRFAILGWCAFACIALAEVALAQEDDDLEDVLGGFEDDQPQFEVELTDDEAAAPRWWEVSGSLETSGSVNYRSHRSDTGTDYRGLQRLRNRLNLQLDVELSREWALRLEGWTFYDAAYSLNGRGDYTRQVLNEYELDADLGEAWVRGALHEAVDIKVGRQVVIWGRSETLRVLDILNPLDNREPGRVDLEDLRRALGKKSLPFTGFRSKRISGIASAVTDQLPA